MDGWIDKWMGMAVNFSLTMTNIVGRNAALA